MNGIHHRLRIRETCRIEFMTSPRIFFPMTPVHHDIIYRYISLSESFKGLNHLSGSFVTLAALPISHGPFWHHLSLSGKGAVAAYDLVHIFSRNEIPVHLLRHFAPPLMLGLLLRYSSIISTETAVRDSSIRLPFHLESCLATSL